MVKASSAEVERRVTKVAGWLINGWGRARICEYALNNEGWRVSASQIDRYIAKARELIRASYQSDWDANRAIADARYEDLYAKALEGGDLRLAAKIVGEQIALRRPEAESGFASNEDFACCLATYADALRRYVPQPVLLQVVEAVRELAPVAESLNDVVGFDYNSAMSVAVNDYKTLGRSRTREELIADGVFDGLRLPE